MEKHIKSISTTERPCCLDCGRDYTGKATIIDGEAWYPRGWVCQRCYHRRDHADVFEQVVKAGVASPALEDALRHEARPDLNAYIDKIGKGDAPCARWLWGDTGAGKTCQAILALYRWAYYHPDERAVFTTQADMLARTHWSHKTPHEVSHYADAAFLVIDDCGRGGGGSANRLASDSDTIWRVIEARHAASRPTLFTANIKASVLCFDDSQAGWDSAILSRLCQMLGSASSMIEFQGDHRRSAFMGGGWA